MKVGAIIPAAGCGKRIGGSIPKQFIKFKGEPLLHHTLMVFSSCELVDYVILVMPQADADAEGKDWLSKYKIIKKIVVGGEQRQDSVYNGFNSLEELTEIVVVHDGVRPFATPQMIISTVEEARKYGAAITAIPVSDTIKKVTDGFVEKTITRDGLWRVQTPQAFKYDLLKEAFQKAQRDSYYGTDEGSLVEYLGEPVRIVSGSELNMKITHKEDLIIGKSLLLDVK
jgi:2-C-methyl-D-erythritol 4-phosphate cytidylyltransferase